MVNLRELWNVYNRRIVVERSSVNISRGWLTLHIREKWDENVDHQELFALDTEPETVVHVRPWLLAVLT